MKKIIHLLIEVKPKSMKQKGHQGDVQFKELKTLPSTAKKIEKKPVALGEINGHQHVITGDYDLYEDQNRLFAVIGKKGAMLQHIHESNFRGYDTAELMPVADHAPATFAPDTIVELGIHRRYEPFQKVWEVVKD